jgi:hypothetical protein
MKPLLVIVGIAACSFVLGAALGIPSGSLIFFCGGVLLLATLATLLVDRYLLSRYEHLLFPADPGCAVPLHARLHQRVHSLDRWGLFLTVGLILYSLIYGVYLAVRIYEAIIERVFLVFRHM